MQRARARWSSEAVVSGGVIIFGLMTVATGSFRSLPLLGAVMLAGGAAWIVFISLFNVLILNHTPDWVRARVLAVSMLAFQGAMAAGSAVWGALATKTGIHAALLWAGLGTMVSTLTGLFLKLPDSAVDLTPWIDWRLPTVLNRDLAPTDADAGPILVTIEYDVDAEQVLRLLRRLINTGAFDGATAHTEFRKLFWPEHKQRNSENRNQMHGLKQSFKHVRSLEYEDFPCLACCCPVCETA